jgi:hypothetical protein
MLSVNMKRSVTVPSSIIMLSIIMLNVTVMSDVFPSVIRVGVVEPDVAAPVFGTYYNLELAR